MPKDRPNIAGTMMNTSSRVNHTVKEMPSNMHSKLSKGETNGPIPATWFKRNLGFVTKKKNPATSVRKCRVYVFRPCPV